ncbi:MAG TPA: IPT/TIG domain-containing protein [Bryobacteraceae bacterium]|nr:IPT/TIG domain-containing protein [Bryobacteraceae bacterium]
MAVPWRVAVPFVAGFWLSFPGLAQNPGITGVANYVTSERPMSAGALAVVVGTSLGPSAAVNMPIWMQDLTVTVGGKPAPILFASSTVLTIQIPVDAGVGSSSVVVQHQGRSSSAFQINLSSYANTIITGASYGDDAKVWTTYCGTSIDSRNPSVPGQALRAYVIGLGQTNPVVPAGTLAPASPLAVVVNPPVVKVGGRIAPFQRAYLAPGRLGVYAVEFTVPQGTPLSAGNQSLWLEMVSTMSNQVPLAFTSETLPVINTIENAGHFSPGALGTPGGIIAVKGANFGTTSSGVDSVFPGTDFGGASVTADGAAVPLFGVFGPQEQINTYVPTELPETGSVSLRVKAGGKTGPACPMGLTSAHPGVFRVFEPPGFGDAAPIAIR